MSGPSQAWAIGSVREYLAGSLTFDQLYRCAFDLLGYRTSCYDTLDEKARERDLLFQFTDAVWGMCLSGVLHGYDDELGHYLPQWLTHLEAGAGVWRETIDLGAEPLFVELE